MRSFSSIQYALSVCAVIAVLVGCSTNGSRFAPSPIQQSAARPALNAVQPDSVFYTPVNKQIRRNAGLRLDLNHDGKSDFTIVQLYGKLHQGCYHGRCWGDCGKYGGVWASGDHNGDVVERDIQYTGYPYWAAALNGGQSIGPKRIVSPPRFQPYLLMGEYEASHSPCQTGYFVQGRWIGVGPKYLGLKFQIQGKTHFGWAEMEVTVPKTKDDIVTTLTGYAYETIAGKAIMAGQK
jgi:hypothetical protein